MNAVERVVRAVDRFQQRHPALAVPFGVIRKFGDDRAGALAGSIAYYAFVCLFPLLLLLTTLLGFALARYPGLESRVLDSAAAEFPIVGDELRRSIQPLRGNAFALVVGILGTLWGSLGVTQAGQHAMAEVWAVPGVGRPNFLSRLARGLGLFAVLGIGLAGSTALSSLSTVSGAGLWGRVLPVAGSAVVNVGLYVAAFRVMTPRQVPGRQLVPGAVLGGLGWTVVQAVGGYLVAHQLRNAGEVYGFFAYVLGLLSWLYVGAQLAMYAAELNVVVARRLWPRSIVQPPLTSADERVLTALVRKEERRPEQHVTVRYDDAATDVPGDGDDVYR
jgi:YihY family inner membrane protein